MVSNISYLSLGICDVVNIMRIVIVGAAPACTAHQCIICCHVLGWEPVQLVDNMCIKDEIHHGMCY